MVCDKNVADVKECDGNAPKAVYQIAGWMVARGRITIAHPRKTC